MNRVYYQMAKSRAKHISGIVRVFSHARKGVTIVNLNWLLNISQLLRGALDAAFCSYIPWLLFSSPKVALNKVCVVLKYFQPQKILAKTEEADQLTTGANNRPKSLLHSQARKIFSDKLLRHKQKCCLSLLLGCCALLMFYDTYKKFNIFFHIKTSRPE